LPASTGRARFSGCCRLAGAFKEAVIDLGRGALRYCDVGGADLAAPPVRGH
jgi:hypothetical protein